MRSRTIVLLAAAASFAFFACACDHPVASGNGAVSLEPIENIAERVHLAIDQYLASLEIDARETLFSASSALADGVVVVSGRTSDKELSDALMAKIAAIGDERILDSLVFLPGDTLGDLTHAIVSVPVLDLGDGPRSSGGSHTVTQARLGEIFSLLLFEDGWYLGKGGDGYLGWIDPDMVCLCTVEEAQAYQDGPVALVSAAKAQVVSRSDESPLFPEAIVRGSLLAYEGTQGQWAHVSLPDGRVGMVRLQDVVIFENAQAAFAEEKGADFAIAIAKEHMGLPYLWGGTTSYGFDCSGLTQFAMKMAGYPIRRDADMQYEQGEPVLRREDLLPGDLVFFETYRKGPSHVGIYLGDSRYIQSGSSLGISILSFDPSHWDYSKSLDDAYLGARRIIR